VLPSERRLEVLTELRRYYQRIGDVEECSRALSRLLTPTAIESPGINGPDCQPDVLRAIEDVELNPDEGCKSAALVQIARQIGIRPELVDRAWNCSLCIQSPDFKTKALLAFMPIWGEAQRVAHAMEVFLAIQSIDNMVARSEALAQLLPSLEPTVRVSALQSTLDAAQRISDPYDHNRALIPLLPYAEQRQRERLVREVVNSSQSITDEDYRSDILIRLAQRVALNEEAFRQALRVARRIVDDQDRAGSIGVLVPYAPSEERASLFTEARRVAGQLEYTASFRSWFFDNIVLPNVPKDEALACIQEELVALIESGHENEYLLNQLIEELRPYPTEDLRRVLSAVLRALARTTRIKLFRFLSVAQPLLASAYGPDGIAEIAAAITDIVRHFE